MEIHVDKIYTVSDFLPLDEYVGIRNKTVKILAITSSKIFLKEFGNKFNYNRTMVVNNSKKVRKTLKLCKKFESSLYKVINNV